MSSSDIKRTQLDTFISGIVIGVIIGAIFFLIMLILTEDPSSPSNSAIKAGHAHYDENTGNLIWNSGNCRMK